jgi:hypothetical protein
MKYLSDATDEFVVELREWCKNNPLDISEYHQKHIPPISAGWNKGIAHSEETKKLISESKKGKSCNKGKKAPYAKENLKKIKHRAFGQYHIVFPNSDSIIIINLKEFCKKMNLSYTSMSSLANGNYPGDSYKKYKCFKICYIKIHQ